MIKLLHSADWHLDAPMSGHSPEATELLRREQKKLPEKIVNVIRCKNPRCITSVEQEIDHIFKLADREERIYRCAYCESEKKKK